MEEDKKNGSINKFKKILTTNSKLRINEGVTSFIEKNLPECRFLNLLDVGVYLVNYQDQTFKYMNEYLLDFLGFEQHEIINQSINLLENTVFPPDYDAMMGIQFKANQVFKKLTNEEKECYTFKLFYRIKKCDGRFCWCVQTTKYINDKEVNSIVELVTIVSFPEHFILDHVTGYLSTINKTMEVFPDEESENPLSVLSKREMEVLKLVSIGLSTLEIANNLELSAATIKNHRKNILKRLNVASSIQAIRILQKHSWKS